MLDTIFEELIDIKKKENYIVDKIDYLDIC